MVKSKSARKRAQNTRKMNGRQSGLGAAGGVLSTTQRLGIPARYPTAAGDVVPLTMKASYIAAADELGFTSAVLIFGKGVTTGDYLFLDDLIPGFGAMCNVYSRFLIRRVRMEVRTVSATLSGGYAAMNYEPTDSNRANPPTSLIDVSNSVHYAMATAGAPGVVVVSPTDYFNDWKQCVNDTATNDPYSTQMGVSQVIGGGFTPNAAAAVMVSVEVEAYFCGYRASG